MKIRLNIVKKAWIGIGLAIVFCLFFLSLLIDLWGRTVQPLAFNHQIHAENGLVCLDCHSFYSQHASSGRPALETCAACHQEALSDSEEEAKLLGFVRKEEEIPWKRLYRLPEDVYFSHRRHVVSGEIQCSVCHGGIGQSSRPPFKPQKISMKKCMDCHEKKEADNDCIACHR